MVRTGFFLFVFRAGFCMMFIYGVVYLFLVFSSFYRLDFEVEDWDVSRLCGR